MEGNERVVRPRLGDAKFFFDQDRKKTLESRVAGLGKVVYHGKLGTKASVPSVCVPLRTPSSSQLRLGTMPYTVDDKDHFDVLDSKAQEAARLAKTDLLTDMVGEFPELQGIMGGYYARHEGLRDGWPSPLKITTSRVLRAMRCRVITRVRLWPWPISSRPWSACSGLANYPPVTRTLRLAPPCPGRDSYLG